MFAYSEIRELICICFVRTGLDGDPQIMQTSSIKIQWDGTQMGHDDQYFHWVISRMLCARLRMPFQMLISFPKNPLTWEAKWKDRVDMHHMVVFWVSDRRARKSSHISSKYHSVTTRIWTNTGTAGRNAGCGSMTAVVDRLAETFPFMMKTGDRTKGSTEAPRETMEQVNEASWADMGNWKYPLSAHLHKSMWGLPRLKTKRQFVLLEEMLGEWWYLASCCDIVTESLYGFGLIPSLGLSFPSVHWRDR